MFYRWIPHALTLGNLLSGCIGILLFPQWPAAWFVWISCLFDFSDGFAARLLRVTSPLGKQLDSLADVVSFGLLPALLMQALLKEFYGEGLIPYLSLLIVCCAAWRLAVFNIDDAQHDSFRGLPTPANALFITGLPFFADLGWRIPGPALIVICIIFSFLMVSPIRLFSLKFTDFSMRKNKLQLTFLFLAVLSTVILKFAAIPFVILLYIVASFTVRKRIQE